MTERQRKRKKIKTIRERNDNISCNYVRKKKLDRIRNRNAYIRGENDFMKCKSKYFCIHL